MNAFANQLRELHNRRFVPATAFICRFNDQFNLSALVNVEQLILRDTLRITDLDAALTKLRKTQLYLFASCNHRKHFTLRQKSPKTTTH